MFTTINYRKALSVLICVTFSILPIISCNEGSNELEKARKRAQTAETELKRVKEELKRVKEERYGNISDLISKLPRAFINNVQIEQKKKNVHITINFDIYNRKGIEGSVILYFYRQDGTKLLKNNKQIIIKEKFTPKRVEDTLTEEFTLSGDDLSVKQPRTLQVSVRIYDEPTESYLNKERQIQTFFYDPFKK